MYYVKYASHRRNVGWVHFQEDHGTVLMVTGIRMGAARKWGRETEKKVVLHDAEFWRPTVQMAAQQWESTEKH